MRTAGKSGHARAGIDIYDRLTRSVWVERHDHGVQIDGMEQVLIDLVEIIVRAITAVELPGPQGRYLHACADRKCNGSWHPLASFSSDDDDLEDVGCL